MRDTSALCILKAAHHRADMRSTAAAIFAAIFCLASHSALAAEQQAIQLATDPFLSNDGSFFVFSYRGDIWRASTEGGLARRLTQHPAAESTPQLSPDGGALYFTSTRSGTAQVHRRPLDGGPTEQLTFNTEGSRLECIAPDELSIIVGGYRDQAGGRAPSRLIEVRIDSRSPERILFDDYAAEASLSSDAHRLLFTRDGERIFRKGYHGPRASKIWHRDRISGEFEQLIVGPHEARSPLFAPDATGFYYTQEADAVANLFYYDFDSKTSRRLTSHRQDSVLMPQLARDGSRLIYRHGFDFFTVATAANAQPERISLYHTDDLADLESETLTISSTSDADFSSSGLEIAFSQNGEVYAMDTILKEPNPLTQSAAFEHDVVFSPSGDAIYYVRDDGVDANIYKATRRDDSIFWWQAADLEHTPITLGPEPKIGIQFSPDGEKLGYISGKGDIWVSDLDGDNAKRIVSSWSRPSFDWSPDSRWITYSTSDDNFNNDVFIVPVDGSLDPINISRHPDDERGPAWSPDGKMIAFVGKRHGSAVDIFVANLTREIDEETERDRKRREAIEKMRKSGGYKKKPDPEPADEPTEDTPETTDEEDSSTDEGEAESNGDEPAEEPQEEEPEDLVEIDTEDLHERLRRLEVTGTPTGLHWSPDSKKIYYRSGSDLHSVEAKGGSSTRVTGDAGHILRIEKGDKIYWISKNAPAVFHKKKNTRYTFETTYERDRSDFQRQVIRRIWRTMRDTFYDPALNNRDWAAILEKYEPAAANAQTSGEFDQVAEMLLGELNASHMGFTPNTYPATWRPPNSRGHITRHTGCRFDRSHTTGGLKVASIIPGSPAAEQKSLIEPGEIVLEIDGTPVDFRTPLPSVLNGPAEKDITLLVRDIDGTERTVIMRGISYGRARSLARDEQLDGNAERVTEMTDGKVGYIHVARMAWPEFEEFERQIFEQGYGKDGLIIDVRDNGGGFTADHLLTVLTPPSFTFTVPRDGGQGYPHSRRVYATWRKPIVVLCNQHSYSNAEIFSHAVKDLGRGKLVGVPTAGGVISTGSTNILGFGSLRLPFRGWFLNRNGEDMELYPAVPDVLVWPDIGTANTDADRQLRTAVEVIAEEIQAAKDEAAKPPKYRSQNPRK